MKKSSTKSVSSKIIIFLVTAVTVVMLITHYGERWLRSLLLNLSAAAWARELISNLPLAQMVAHRFVAGDTLNDAMTTTKDLNAAGKLVTLDLLGESVTNAAEAGAACDGILALLDRTHDEGVNASVSVKLSQLGLKIDPGLAHGHMQAILGRARQYGLRVRIDMEESTVVDQTLALFRRLRDEGGFDNVGVVIQSYLHRSEADVRQLVEEGANIRLCKGAYKEPPEIAFPDKAETDANFVLLMQRMLTEEARQQDVYLGVATHDEKMIEATKAYAQTHDIPQDAYEFQMLYGIRQELQNALVADGYQLRVYVPYGTAWYPYFMRRLAERPANLWFFIKNFFKA